MGLDDPARRLPDRPYTKEELQTYLEHGLFACRYGAKMTLGGMAALIQAKLTPQAAVASMTTGRRFGGPDAQAYGIVDAVATEAAVTADALELLRPLAGKDPGTLGAMSLTFAPFNTFSTIAAVLAPILGQSTE